LSGRCAISRNSLAVANSHGCVIFACVLTHFPFLSHISFLLPNPSPLLPSSPLLDPSMFAYRAAGRRGQERWFFSRRVLPDLLPAVSELVSHQSSASSPRTSPLMTTHPTTHMPIIAPDIPHTAPHWPSLKPTRSGSPTHPSNPARSFRVLVVHVLRPSRSSVSPQPRRSTLVTSH